MLDGVQNFIPVMTSNAGLCLTVQNWQEAKTEALSFYLDSLLLKPGYELLKKIPSVFQYMGWVGYSILNASRCVANKEGVITLKSPYDGSKLKLSTKELIDLIQHIKPIAVILPLNIIQNTPGFWHHWNKEIIPFFAEEDLLKQDIQRQHGIYLQCNDSMDKRFVSEQLKRWSHLPKYVMGNCTLDLMQELQAAGVNWIESDQPAALAMSGILLKQDTLIDIADIEHATSFASIDEACNCPTCSLSLTKAYLHHLYLHTPLLCQRFLMQHNIYYVQNYLGN